MASLWEKTGRYISGITYVVSLVIIILLVFFYFTHTKGSHPDLNRLADLDDAEPLLFLADFQYGITKTEFNMIAQSVSSFTEHACTESVDGMEMCISTVPGSGVEEAVVGLFYDNALVGLSYWGNFKEPKTADIVQMTELITYNFRQSFKTNERSSGSLTFVWEKNGYFAVQFVKKTDQNYIVNFTQFPDTYTQPMIDVFKKSAILFGIDESMIQDTT